MGGRRQLDEELNKAYQNYIEYKKEVSEKNTEIERIE
jgi:uncharacterized protein YecT (DUF1311 family)